MEGLGQGGEHAYAKELTWILNSQQMNWQEVWGVERQANLAGTEAQEEVVERKVWGTLTSTICAGICRVFQEGNRLLLVEVMGPSLLHTMVVFNKQKPWENQPFSSQVTDVRPQSCVNGLEHHSSQVTELMSKSWGGSGKVKRPVSLWLKFETEKVLKTKSTQKWLLRHLWIPTSQYPQGAVKRTLSIFDHAFPLSRVCEQTFPRNIQQSSFLCTSYRRHEEILKTTKSPSLHSVVSSFISLAPCMFSNVCVFYFQVDKFTVDLQCFLFKPQQRNENRSCSVNQSICRLQETLSKNILVIFCPNLTFQLFSSTLLDIFYGVSGCYNPVM